jgi:hypothetical protein
MAINESNLANSRRFIPITPLHQTFLDGSVARSIIHLSREFIVISTLGVRKTPSSDKIVHYAVFRGLTAARADAPACTDLGHIA